MWSLSPDHGLKLILCPHLDGNLDFSPNIGHIWPMDAPIFDSLAKLGGQIRTRRLAMGLTQADAAGRAGVAYRTWRRMEKDGSASIEDLVRAALALRCEQGLASLFPEPAASSMDELLVMQRLAAEMKRRQKMRKARL